MQVGLLRLPEVLSHGIGWMARISVQKQCDDTVPSSVRWPQGIREASALGNGYSNRIHVIAFCTALGFYALHRSAALAKRRAPMISTLMSDDWKIMQRAPGLPDPYPGLW